MTEGGNRLLGRPGDGNGGCTAVGLLRPYDAHIEQRVDRRIVLHLGAGFRKMQLIEPRNCRRREIGFIGSVGGDCVVRFPRFDSQRDLEYVRIDPVVPAEVLAAQHPFVSAQRPGRSRRDVVCQIGPGVGAGGDFPQRPECEAARLFVHDRPGELTRGIEGEAILGVLGRRPKLEPLLFKGVPAPIPQFDHPVPLPGGAEAVHEPDQLIEIARFDGVSERGHGARG